MARKSDRLTTDRLTTEGDDRPALVWFTRDLRLGDQPALQGAVASGRRLVLCYVLDAAEGGAWAIGGAARWWLHHSLAALAESLRGLGATLVLRRGDAVEEIVRLVGEISAAAVHVGQAIEPAGRTVLDTVQKRAGTCTVERYWTTLLFDPATVQTKTGGAYGVYTPFSKACFAMGVGDGALPAPTALRVATAPRSDDLGSWGLLPTKPDWSGGMREAWTVGEAAAGKQLERFVAAGLQDYAAERNLPGHEGVSRMSPHLHWGEISARTIWLAAGRQRGKGVETYLKEVLWREFSAHLLWHHPELPDAPLRAQYAAMQWREAPDELRAWQRGLTGVPIVDAGMRQLWVSGWQHNRVRLITASFLIKHLLIDWKAGESWFWDCLVDADLGSNSQNWQWVAGCGADASPFFRIFNPWLQGQKFDPDGVYVKRWVPELAGLDVAYIHAPWEAPAEALAAAGVTLGESYPRPIIDLAEGRDRALAAFRDVSDKARSQAA